MYVSSWLNCWGMGQDPNYPKFLDGYSHPNSSMSLVLDHGAYVHLWHRAGDGLNCGVLSSWLIMTYVSHYGTHQNNPHSPWWPSINHYRPQATTMMCQLVGHIRAVLNNGSTRVQPWFNIFLGVNHGFTIAQPYSQHFSTPKHTSGRGCPLGFFRGRWDAGDGCHHGKPGAARAVA